jgi:hypothetical protein
MRLKLVVSTALAVSVSVVFATATWAQKGKKKDAQQEVVPDSINRQFQWEEKVVGPKDKGVDHKKIAALQEQGRREDEARKKEPPKKAQRAEGIDAPASSTLPTMDIEKPATGLAKRPKKVAAAEPPRQHDALDNILSQETGKSDGFSDRDRKGGLGAILASDDAPSQTRTTHAVRHTKTAKRVHRRRN